jgi:hypothetical protein
MSEYSIDIAHYCNKLNGPLKNTGTVSFEISFPIESLITDQMLIFTFGSLNQGSCDLSFGSFKY